MSEPATFTFRDEQGAEIKTPATRAAGRILAVLQGASGKPLKAEDLGMALYAIVEDAIREAVTPPSIASLKLLELELPPGAAGFCELRMEELR
jgi:hypothetical protein